MAEQPKPAEEPVVPDPISGEPDAFAEAERKAADTSGPEPERDPIPDAELVEDRTDPPAEPEPEPVPRAAPPAEAQPVAQPAPPPAPPPPVAPPRRSGAFLGFVTGGVIAAAGGFGLARYMPDLLPVNDTSALTAMTAQLEQQAAAMAELKSQIDALAAPQMPDLGPELAALRSDIEAQLAALPVPPDPATLATEARAAAEAALADLNARLAAVEAQPAVTVPGTGVSEAALAAYDAELQALKTALEQQTAAGAGASEDLIALAAETESQLAAAAAEAEKLKTEAEAAGREALARAALGRILAALDAGGPFSSAVTELADAGKDVPAVLVETAGTGVPTLPDLQRGFPDAARAALDAALKASVGDTWTDRVAAYLRTQTKARSLTPLEGNDPDAVLSRAEAALGAGQIDGTLTELAALPDVAKAPLADWIAAAEGRQAAVAAVAALTTALDTQ